MDCSLEGKRNGKEAKGSCPNISNHQSLCVMAITPSNHVVACFFLYKMLIEEGGGMWGGRR